ncbi:MAG: DNRLRE domain-containing protein [Gemmataceae bacterium]|nr:DNRLRE domain-containing protein [Gemmataceae bacterium]MDW8264968.1 DNRLRE domain-containing protein [Gemmataceae bacterium]
MLRYRSLPLEWLLCCLLCCGSAAAAPNDWAEGTTEKGGGATRDYYNAAAQLEWKNKMGDWRDARNTEQGGEAYAVAVVGKGQKDKFVEWDVTSLVKEWQNGTYPSQGFFLRLVKGKGAFDFASRESANADQRPQLVLTGDKGHVTLAAQADTFLEGGTHKSMGHLDYVRLSTRPNHALVRFDLGGAKDIGNLRKAVLRLFCVKQTSDAEGTLGVFRCRQDHEVADKEPIFGLAAKYPGDKGIDKDPDVVFFSDFEPDRWDAVGWTVGPSYELKTIAADAERKFEPLQGKALSAMLAKGESTALNLMFKFKNKLDAEPEEMYFRYYLRFGDDWNQTVQGGKMPGFSGTYNKAGWGGRKAHGDDGWSARGAYALTIPADNPLGGRHPIGNYVYHADMTDNYGDIWLWTRGYRGFLEKNCWYCIEQQVKLNTPGKKDGELRGWVDGRLAFEKADLRFRTVDKLKIEQVWMNIYHGGTLKSPYDQHVFIDNVVVARKYIGPMMGR